MNCPTCGCNMTDTKKDYKYAESGLDNITLKNLTMLVCECGEEMPVISNILDLHKDIALGIIKKSVPLTGSELRFLRKEMKVNASKFAETLGVNPVTVSRWERNEEPIGPANDKLIRHLYVRKLEGKENKLIQIDIPDGSLQAAPETPALITIDDLTTTQDIAVAPFAYWIGYEDDCRYLVQPTDTALGKLEYAANSYEYAAAA